MDRAPQPPKPVCIVYYICVIEGMNLSNQVIKPYSAMHYNKTSYKKLRAHLTSITQYVCCDQVHRQLWQIPVIPEKVIKALGDPKGVGTESGNNIICIFPGQHIVVHAPQN